MSMIIRRKSPFLILSLLCAFLPSLQAGLVFEETDITIEAGLLDSKVEPVFRFTNEGTKPVVVLDLKSSCGCTVPQLEKKTYAPGESGEIRAVFTFGGRIGLQRKRVTVMTNDPQTPVHQLVFATTIPQWAEVEPKILRWTLEGEPEPREVRLRIHDPERVSVAGDGKDAQHFEMTRKDGGPGEWVFSIVPKDTSARVTERISFTLTATDGEREETRQLAFHCLVR